jgi:truncated hemoglobin YjbI
MSENQKPITQFEFSPDDNPFIGVIDFLNRHLPDFPNVFKEITKTEKIKSEDYISQKLCSFLQDLTFPNGVFMFQFQWKYQNSRRSSDIVVISRNPFKPTNNPFFTIEAKRLPTPGTGREKEYVEGNLGGIERYKRSHHGKDLPQSAIIGYIQKEICPHWHKKINEWIDALIQTNTEVDIIWDKADLLIHTDDFDKVQKYVSDNKREKDSIKLHHYLMELV